MRKYRVIVPASKDYIPGLEVFLTSFYKYHDIGVTLLNYDLPKEFLSRWDFEDVIQLPTDITPKVVCKLASYEFMANCNDVVMLADADSFFLANVKFLFDIASTGYIVGSANGQNVTFKQDYADLTGLNVAGKHQYRTIAAPYVADCAKFGRYFQEAVNAWRGIGNLHGTSIWLLFNAIIALHDLQESLILFPAQQLTNLHQKMLKPGTRVRNDKGKLMTEDGLQVLMCHDKWWKPNFIDGLMAMGEKFCKGDSHCLNQWKGSRDLLKKEFDGRNSNQC
jgi:hypothetical protein